MSTIPKGLREAVESLVIRINDLDRTTPHGKYITELREVLTNAIAPFFPAQPKSFNQVMENQKPQPPEIARAINERLFDLAAAQPTSEVRLITPECQPIWPCWLWHPEYKWRAINYHAMLAYTGWTHWHPDQSEPPTFQPTVQGDTAEGETPRTDAQIPYHNRFPHEGDPEWYVSRDFARTLERELASLKQERDYWEKQAEHERDQRQLKVGAQEYRGNTVSYIYDKSKCYGDMVHGCAPAFAQAGFPIDENNPNGRVEAIANAVKKMKAQLTAHQAWEKQAREAYEKARTSLEQAEHKYRDGFDNVPFCELAAAMGALLSALSTPPASGGTQT